LQIDQACAALVRDLKQRGLLESTLVVWGGEFGRTPMNEARGGSQWFGRDHHPRAFTLWMAGAGIRRGVSHGATDELGYHVAENPVTVRDLQATLLHLLGLDARRLSYRHRGVDERLIGPTDDAKIIQGILS
jgi:arylsulfatase A-like enzyme